MSYAEKYEAEQREALCIPTEPCSRATPWGIVQGMKCYLGEEINHNTTIDGLEGIVKEGSIKPAMKKGLLGQDVSSLSSCPAQHYGGNVKLIIPSDEVEVWAACYVNFGSDAPEEHKKVERGMVDRSREKMNEDRRGDLRVRGEFAIQPDIYTEECQYDTKEEISVDKLKRIEYWVPWSIDPWGSYSTRCRGSHPAYANVHGRSLDVLKQQINRAKQAAQKVGADFAVKSCFTALKTGWGDQYISLAEKNLKLLAEGKMPAIERGEIPQKCKC